MFRLFLLTLTLVTHAAAALLGHAGLHDVVGHHHGGDVAKDSVRSASTHVCSHGHSHHDHTSHAHDHGGDHQNHGQDGETPNQHHDHDGDCVVCQFTAQTQSPLALFDLPVLDEVQETACSATEQLAATAVESAFDSRGPPTA